MYDRNTRSRFLLITLIFLALPASSFAVVPCLYTEHAGSSTVMDFGYSIATDAAENIYVCGTFANTANFGGGVLTSAGGNDIFVAKYNATGGHVWSFSHGSPGDDIVLGIAVDASGNVAITGSFTGTINLGGSDLTASGARDLFLASYDAVGVHRWSHNYDGTDTRNDVSTVAFDPDGNVILGGRYAGAADFGGGPLPAFGAPEMMLVKFDTNGAHLWSKGFATSGGEWVQDVACDADGNVCVLAWNGGGNDFGGGLVAPGAAVVKFDPAGTHIWSKGFTGAITPRAIALDASANVFLSGSFLETVNFGGGDLVSAGSADVFLTKLDAAGTLQWSKRYGGTLHDYGMGVGTDPSGNVFLTGHYYGSTFDFGGDPLPVPGSYDGFLVKFTTNGDHVWTRPFGGASPEQSWDLAVDGSGNPAVTGGFTGAVDFGTGTVNAGSTIRSDMFAVKYAGDGVASGVGGTPARGLSVTSYPNPFNPRTTIRYTVPDRGHVTVAVYDARGSHVATLFDGERAAGAYAAEWNGRAANGLVVGSGVYFARIQHNGVTSSHKMVLLK